MESDPTIMMTTDHSSPLEKVEKFCLYENYLKNMINDLFKGDKKTNKLRDLNQLLSRPFFRISPNVPEHTRIEESYLYVERFQGFFHDAFSHSELNLTAGLACITKDYYESRWQYRLFIKDLVPENGVMSIGLETGNIDEKIVVQDWVNPENELCCDSLNELIGKLNRYLLEKEGDGFGYVHVFPDLNKLIKSFGIQASKDLIECLNSENSDNVNGSTNTKIFEFGDEKFFAKYCYNKITQNSNCSNFDDLLKSSANHSSNRSSSSAKHDLDSSFSIEFEPLATSSVRSSTNSDTSQSDTSQSDTSQSDFSQSDTSQSDTSQSDFSQSDTSQSDFSQSDASISMLNTTDGSESLLKLTDEIHVYLELKKDDNYRQHFPVLRFAHFPLNSQCYHPNTFALIFEFAENGDLKTYAAKESSKNIVVKLKWVVQILDAIEFLHQRGILHLDLKPDNILITSNGSAKVTDFDLSLPVGSVLKVSRGTPPYWSPEQKKGRGSMVSEKSDVYAVGMLTVYLMLNQIRGNLIRLLMNAFGEFDIKASDDFMSKEHTCRDGKLKLWHWKFFETLDKYEVDQSNLNEDLLHILDGSFKIEQEERLAPQGMKNLLNNYFQQTGIHGSEPNPALLENTEI